jgi:hypothetical protein
MSTAATIIRRRSGAVLRRSALYSARARANGKRDMRDRGGSRQLHATARNGMIAQNVHFQVGVLQYGLQDV